MIRITRSIMVVALIISAISVNAQNFKFGHINSQELIIAMPERDSAEAKLKRYAQELQDQIETLQVEFNKKYQDYLQKKATFTDAIREMKEKELNDLQTRSQEFEQTAQQDYQRQQGELMRPIMEKADAAIKKIAKANGFTYVFDIGAGGVVYFSEQSTDILPLVKKELGIKK
ncbi:MAG: OmpH family outer membrane protein [Tenuifilaceae bacterium]